MAIDTQIQDRLIREIEEAAQKKERASEAAVRALVTFIVGCFLAIIVFALYKAIAP